MLYMLDTNTACAAPGGTAGLDQRLEKLDPSQWCISAVTHSEVRFGTALS
jgi:tRNA(fMet)-specific endonuclease VapC